MIDCIRLFSMCDMLIMIRIVMVGLVVVLVMLVDEDVDVFDVCDGVVFLVMVFNGCFFWDVFWLGVFVCFEENYGLFL